MNILSHIGAAVVLTVAFFLIGCTPQERSGLSPIPQNSPASWENSAWGPGR